MKKNYTASFYSPLWHVRNPKQKGNIENMLFAKKQLKEVFEWYAEWLLNDSEDPQELIEWMCDNLNPKALQTVISTYEFYEKED